MNERNWDSDWAMCEIATPGPCHIERRYDFPDGLYSAIIVLDNPLPNRPDDKYLMIVIGRDREEVDRDAGFYAEARSALPYWLKRVKELEAENARLQAVAEAAKRLRKMHVFDEKTNVHKLNEGIVHIDAEEELFAAVDALEERESDG